MRSFLAPESKVMHATTARPVSCAAAVASAASAGSDMVSTTIPSAPASAIARACSAKAAFSSSSLTWPIISITPLGPTEANTATRPSHFSAARREMSTPARLISATLSARPCRARMKRLAPKVFV